MELNKQLMMRMGLITVVIPMVVVSILYFFRFTDYMIPMTVGYFPWYIQVACGIGGGGAWGSITGTLASQTDLQTVLDGKQSLNSINLIDATSGNQTYTLPTAIGISGKTYIIKKIDTSTNTVTIATTSSQTIDGYSTITFSNQYQCYTLVSNGSNWYIISIL